MGITSNHQTISESPMKRSFWFNTDQQRVVTFGGRRWLNPPVPFCLIDRRCPSLFPFQSVKSFSIGHRGRSWTRSREFHCWKHWLIALSLASSGTKSSSQTGTRRVNIDSPPATGFLFYFSVWTFSFVSSVSTKSGNSGTSMGLGQKQW